MPSKTVFALAAAAASILPTAAVAHDVAAAKPAAAECQSRYVIVGYRVTWYWGRTPIYGWRTFCYTVMSGPN